MSHNAHSAPAKFKLDFPPFWDVEMDQDDDLDIEIFPKSFGENNIPEALRSMHRIVWCKELEHPSEPCLGWSAVKGTIEKEHGKKYAGIIAHKLVKGDHEVWYVNESHYSNVGYESPAFIAFDEASIKALKKDIGSGKLDTDTTVMSSW